jgi:hypothetical protein
MSAAATSCRSSFTYERRSNLKSGLAVADEPLEPLPRRVEASQMAESRSAVLASRYSHWLVGDRGRRAFDTYDLAREGPSGSSTWQTTPTGKFQSCDA